MNGQSAGLPTLTTTHAAHELSRDEAKRAYPVRIRGVVTYYNPDFLAPGSPAWFLNDATGGIFVMPALPPAVPLKAGEAVEVTGVSAPGLFAPIIDRALVRHISDSVLPRANKVNLSNMLSGAKDSQWVEVEGIVRSVEQFDTNVILNLALSDGLISAISVRGPKEDYSGLVDARIQVRGNAAPIFNHSGQITGAQIYFPAPLGIELMDRPPADPFGSPSVPVAGLLHYSAAAAIVHRSHVHGVVTLVWPGRTICIQDGQDGLCAQTAQKTLPRLGEMADLVGFPAMGSFTPTLSDVESRARGPFRRTDPVPVTAEQAITGSLDARLVAIEGVLVGRDLSAKDPTLILSSGRFMFPAVIALDSVQGALPVWREGATLRITGICSVQADSGQHLAIGGHQTSKSFRLLLRSAAGVQVLRNPSWWNAQHALRVLALALLIALGVLAWVIVLRNRIKLQSEVIGEQLKEAAALTEAAESASRAKSEFVANMSHEIRTPMNGVLGMIGLTLETSVTPQQRHLLEIAGTSAEALLRVVNDILDYSKIEAGKLDLDPLTFQLRAHITNVVEPLVIRAEAKGLKLVCSFAPEVPDEILADSNRLSQIIINLVGNSIKFTQKGEIRLTIGLDGIEDGWATLRFTVADTGLGIPLDRQKTIFEAFSQADTSTTRNFGGTGLGLTICSRLTRLMGGEIGVESQPAQGSVFHFTIKAGILRALAVAKQPAATPLPSFSKAALRILVAEDNSTNQLVAAGILKSRGHTVAIAASGQEAVDAWTKAESENQPFDLILMDAQMPGMDGFEATRTIRTMEMVFSGHTPIVALTASAMTGDRERCLAAGMDGYATKPIRAAELLREIERVLETHPAGGSAISLV